MEAQKRAKIPGGSTPMKRIKDQKKGKKNLAWHGQIGLHRRKSTRLWVDSLPGTQISRGNRKRRTRNRSPKDTKDGDLPGEELTVNVWRRTASRKLTPKFRYMLEESDGREDQGMRKQRRPGSSPTCKKHN